MLMITLYAEQKKKKETQIYRTVFKTLGEGEGGMFQENSIETCILSRVKQITGPRWMHETSARSWCSWKTCRERVGREVRGGIGMGKTYEPKAFSFQCMTKFTTNKKKRKKEKKKSQHAQDPRRAHFSFSLSTGTSCQYALLHAPVQMLISSRKTPIDAQNNV